MRGEHEGQRPARPRQARDPQQLDQPHGEREAPHVRARDAADLREAEPPKSTVLLVSPQEWSVDG